MTADEFRDIALEMQGAIEGAHMGHPDFRASGRIFASLHTNDTRGMVKLTPEEQAELMKAKPKMFEPSAGAWGRQGCTNVVLEKADARTLRQALTLAWEGVMAKPPQGRRQKAAALRTKTRGEGRSTKR
jgi:hypothetical protein